MLPCLEKVGALFPRSFAGSAFPEEKVLQKCVMGRKRCNNKAGKAIQKSEL
jgi:hypothetical protein